MTRGRDACPQKSKRPDALLLAGLKSELDPPLASIEVIERRSARTTCGNDLRVPPKPSARTVIASSRHTLDGPYCLGFEKPV
jgi:hypothetical protein